MGFRVINVHGGNLAQTNKGSFHPTFTFRPMSTFDGPRLIDADQLEKVAEASEQAIMSMGAGPELLDAWKRARDGGLPANQQLFIARFHGGKLLLGSTDNWTFRVMRCMAETPAT